MQFDDRLSTLVSTQPVTDAGRAALWSQLIDLLAQGHPTQTTKISDRIVEMAGSVSPDRRLAAARAVASRTRSPELVLVFGTDIARVAAPVMSGATLAPAEWQQVIPQLAPHARALLRQRRDLPREAQEALLSFGHSDFAIPAIADATPEPESENTQIRDLMTRIANWREKRAGAAEKIVSEPAAASQFRFEADANGAVYWTDSPERAALIGLSLAEKHEMRDVGFDAHATGAFAKRTPFRHARLTLPQARLWSIAGDPVFRASDGRFLGYRCLARSVARATEPEVPASGGGDAFRQLAHELRTPLNAVDGFAAMIEGQVLGPVGESHRWRAVAIREDAARILGVIDEVDGWSREAESGGDLTDIAATIASVLEICRALEHERGANLRFRIAADIPEVAVGAATATRLVHALARVILSAAEAGESVLCEVRADSGVTLAFAKPAALAGIEADGLLSDDEDAASEDVLPLGIGFTLRMVKAHTRAVGGALDLGGDALVLRLPAMGDSASGAIERL